MSKPKYHWWGYAKSMVRRYPDQINQNELRAVNEAIKETQALTSGDLRMKVVELVLMKGSHDVAGAAIVCNVAPITARYFHSDFIRAVGKHFSCESLIDT